MTADRKSENEKVPLEEAIDKAGFGLYSILLICLTGFGNISFAFIGSSATILVPTSACELETTSGQQGAMAAAPVVGTIVGALLWGYLADTRGRRKMLLVALLGAATINAIGSISVNWIMLMAFQFTASFFAAGIYSMFMTLMSECVPMARRNLVVLVVSSIFMLSQGIMAVIGIPTIPLTFSYYLEALGIYWNSWRTLMLMYSAPCIITAICLSQMEESPKFNFTKGNEEEALKSLERIYRVNHMRSIAEFPVKSIMVEQETKDKSSSSPKDQIIPLFQKPLRKYTLIMITLFSFIMVPPFVTWLPTIMNQVVNIIETGEGTDLTLCGVLRLALDSPVEADPDAVPCALNVTALLIVFAVGGLQSIINVFISIIINKAGRRNVVIALTSVCGLSGILVNVVPNAYASVVLYILYLVGNVVLGVYTSIIVAIFPTHLRAIAIALPLTVTRICVFASIQILNVLLINNCDVGFYVFCSIYFSSSIIATFLPDDRRMKAPIGSNPEPSTKEELAEQKPDNEL